MRFCKAHDNEWVRDDDVCIECGGRGELGYHDWGVTVTRTAAENRALALLTEKTGGKP